MTDKTAFSSDAGIAIGPILFVIALLGLLAAVMASGGSEFQTASSADRITADVSTQANLIRNTINDCNLQYTMLVATNPNALVADPYPATPPSGLVADMGCTPTGTTSLWNSGTANILLPPATNGFSPWHYIDSGTSGGRCIWTAPTSSNPKNNNAIVEGLSRAAGKFNSTTSASAGSEVIYDPTSTSQKFIVWITLPDVIGSADAHCLP